MARTRWDGRSVVCDLTQILMSASCQMPTVASNVLELAGTSAKLQIRFRPESPRTFSKTLQRHKLSSFFFSLLHLHFITPTDTHYWCQSRRIQYRDCFRVERRLFFDPWLGTWIGGIVPILTRIWESAAVTFYSIMLVYFVLGVIRCQRTCCIGMIIMR